MWGCESCEIVFASRSKRWRTSGDEDRWDGRTLTATVRSSRVSRARYTSPIPPAPIAERISYGPNRMPAESVISAPEILRASRRSRRDRAWNLPSASLASQTRRPVQNERDRQRGLLGEACMDEKPSIARDVVLG